MHQKLKSSYSFVQKPLDSRLFSFFENFSATQAIFDETLRRPQRTKKKDPFVSLCRNRIGYWCSFAQPTKRKDKRSTKHISIKVSDQDNSTKKFRNYQKRNIRKGSLTKKIIIIITVSV